MAYILNYIHTKWRSCNVENSAISHLCTISSRSIYYFIYNFVDHCYHAPYLIYGTYSDKDTMMKVLHLCYDTMVIELMLEDDMYPRCVVYHTNNTLVFDSVDVLLKYIPLLLHEKYIYEPPTKSSTECILI